MSQVILFSIIIPVYKDTNRLILCLRALMHQKINGYRSEILVINNDPEGDVEVPRELTDCLNIRIIDEPISGSYAARNTGIKYANGRILAFTDSDCVPDRDWLENAYHLFEHDDKREIGILTGPVPLFFRDSHNLTAAEKYEKHTGFTTHLYVREGKAITANWFSYKDVIEEFGGFNAALKSNGDSDLSGKISSKYKIVYKEDIIVHHPARYHTEDLVNKYRRLLGGAFTRRFEENTWAFTPHVLNFILRRYRFSLKKFFTVPIHESWAIFKVCNAINWGAVKEYFNLIRGGETKR
ncbi:glycosyltransferase family 2 protein [Echinicola marina]|uniref:glycosyltransferase n=1 Tax=Echinicola marina TaxID=2859768 RepID=UPI001CF6FAAB|nr:glycosyltransferase family 2 protein [Echinicola marina]UCS91996.1 glycosyltransferase family 2 protein [Echinicola marina]